MPLQNNYVTNFTIPAGTSTLSGLQPVLPLGSLVYQSTVDNVLVTPTDTDTYDLTIDPQQTISAYRHARDFEPDGDRRTRLRPRQRARDGHFA